MANLRKKRIGYVGVDSGQVLICDPCYIDGEWDHKDEYIRDQKYQVTYNGRVSIFDMGVALESGTNFSSPLRDFDGKSMNDLVREGYAEEIPVEETHVFGYNGCCRASQTEDGGGQLNYKLGHEGAGVCSRTFQGDGIYPVYAYYNQEGRTVKIEVDFR